MTDGYKFYRGLPPHQRHSDTSREAAVLKLTSADTERARVYRYIRDQGPATDEEIQDAIEMPANTERPRRRELQISKPPLIEDSGERGVTRSGRRAVKWAVIETEAQGDLF
jgi:hypothetical protein